MEPWQTLVIALVAPATPGGLWVALRWWINRKDAIDQARQIHDLKMADRFEAMQRAFILELRTEREENEKANAAIEEKLERHRIEHLTDVKASAEVVTQALRVLQKQRDSSKPISSS